MYRYNAQVENPRNSQTNIDLHSDILGRYRMDNSRQSRRVASVTSGKRYVVRFFKDKTAFTS